jgi:putative SOS response-associated peptidase YedK
VCGRFSLTNPNRLKVAFSRYRFREFSDTRGPRFNIAPTQPAVGVRAGRDEVEELTWGNHGRINVRAESLAARRFPIGRRCAIFADGFYEWRGKTPVRYALRSGEPFAFAGVWEDARENPPFCAIVTTTPNELVAPVHDRMPVILAPDALDLWLDGDPLPVPVALGVLRPYDAVEMVARDVSRRLNTPRNDDPAVLEPDDEQPTLGLF